MQTYHDLTIKDTAELLETDIKSGLSAAEAERRLRSVGRNELKEKKKKGFLRRFIEQFNDFMIIILLAAAAISFLTSLMRGEADITEPAIILAIVVLNSLLGCIQQSRAERSLESLKKLSSPHARVVRGGREVVINAAEVVPGDILRLSAGDLAAADCRLISSNNLTIDESALTGESMNVEKNADAALSSLTPLAERKNMVMASTSVTGGNGIGIIVNTGMNTEVGQIASMLLDDETPQTPLQKRLADTGKTLGIAALIICCVIFLIGILKHLPPFDMFMTSVSLAIAAIPEGLPAIVTIMLAIGVIRMSKHNAIVRNLPSVETLGSASVICSDKTGTLTQNKMSVTDIYSNDETLALRYAAMCSDLGEDPTEKAIINAAADRGILKSELDRKHPRISEIPFDSTRKRMATLHRGAHGTTTVVKGALEYVLPLCNQIYNGQKPVPMSVSSKKKILAENNRMTSSALRVIAVAYKTGADVKNPTEGSLIFLGLLGMQDPPRPEVIEAVKVCRRAKIRPVMITGDHAETAFRIAQQTGIAETKSEVMTGAELDALSDEALRSRIQDYSVFARVTPSHKVRIVKALQAKGEVTAMTGDGVNDAPALSTADIGCGMGSGTDVAKSAADMILTDDNFSTIVYAVREGRSIFVNIKKAVQFLLSSNIGEILTVFSGIVFGWSSPLTAIQLLWVNLVTDSLPAIALGLDPCGDDIMQKPPRPPKKSMFADGLWAAIMMEGLMVGALALLAFSIGANVFGNDITGRTMSFAVLSLCQLVHAFNMRSESSVLGRELFKNPYLLLSLTVGAAMEIAVITIPSLSDMFGVVPLNGIQWAIVAALSVMPLLIVEAQKAVSALLHK